MTLIMAPLLPCNTVRVGAGSFAMFSDPWHQVQHVCSSLEPYKESVILLKSTSCSKKVCNFRSGMPACYRCSGAALLGTSVSCHELWWWKPSGIESRLLDTLKMRTQFTERRPILCQLQQIIKLSIWVTLYNINICIIKWKEEVTFYEYCPICINLPVYR